MLLRQLSFFTSFKSNLMNGSPRSLVFDELLVHNNSYLIHYVTLSEQYKSKNEIIQKFKVDLQNEIRRMAENQDRYKFNLYNKFNPTLTPLNFKDIKISAQKFIQLRLSSHSFPIETGRWSRTKREERLCETCGVLGDEIHYIYSCTDVDRTGLSDIPDLCDLGTYDKLNTLLTNLGGNL